MLRTVVFGILFVSVLTACGGYPTVRSFSDEGDGADNSFLTVRALYPHSADQSQAPVATKDLITKLKNKLKKTVPSFQNTLTTEIDPKKGLDDFFKRKLQYR